jgi:transposase
VRIAALLPHLRDLQLRQATCEDGLVQLVAHGRGHHAVCPECQRQSTHVHSHYTRHLTDLPIGGLPVLLHLVVRRFRCLNPRCPRQTFAEQLIPIVAPYARRTSALRRALEWIGLQVGARPGQRLGTGLGLLGRRDSLLRLVRALPDPMPCPARVLGVDEFALRRGHTYGTVIVDGESHRPIDILDDRSADQFAAWLRERPSPEIICRDRGGCYADGARRGAPTAIQVADRYHLLANLGSTVERLVAQHARCWEDDPLSVAPPPEPVSTPPPGGILLERHRGRYEQIHTLVARGQTITAIARHLQLDRKTVRKFARASSPEAISTRAPHAGAPALLRRFYGHLNRRWQEGCEDGAVLCSEIRALGYGGSARTVRRYLTGLRQGQAPYKPKSTIAPRTVVGLLLRHPDHLGPSDRATLERLMERCPDLVTIRRLICAFAESLCERQGEVALGSWLTEASGCGLGPLVNFASGLRKDLAAVTAAVTLTWSSGVVEGNNTRIKLIKRMMYGRARVDLLRKRVLLAA